MHNIVDKIILSQSKTKCWYWEAIAINGETLCHSESYASKSMCLKTAKAVAAQLNVELVK